MGRAILVKYTFENWSGETKSQMVRAITREARELNRARGRMQSEKE